MKVITLYHGEEAFVDDEDFDRLSKFKWHSHGGYARRTFKVGGKWFNPKMHHEVMHRKPGEEYDHINLNRLDNRKENLRKCDRILNCRNRLVSKVSKTGYKGVFPLRGKFQVSIRNGNKSVYLGVFTDPAKAALAYNRGAVIWHGKHARLNSVC